LYGKTSGKEWSVCRELTIDGVESRPKVACTKKNSGKQWSVQREMAVARVKSGPKVPCTEKPPERNGVSAGSSQLMEWSPDLK
jgi:hypothetical protein